MTSEYEHQTPFEGYVEVTLERLIAAHLEDARGQLARSNEEPLRLFLAARSIHLALVTALSSALSGTDGTGAMSERERIRWLAYFEETRAGIAESPDTRMASYKELLARAQKGSVGWVSEPLTLDEGEELALQKLTALRDWTEHPRPDFHYIEPAWMRDALLAGLNVAEKCTNYVWHRYDPEQEDAMKALFRELRVSVEAI